jgi:hypothetical protein
VARHGCSIAAGEEREAVVHSIGDLRRRQRAHSGRCQLDRQGQAVETPADAHGCRNVRVGELEIGLDRGGAGLEQADSLGVCERRLQSRLRSAT